MPGLVGIQRAFQRLRNLKVASPARRGRGNRYLGTGDTCRGRVEQAAGGMNLHAKLTEGICNVRCARRHAILGEIYDDHGWMDNLDRHRSSLDDVDLLSDSQR